MIECIFTLDYEVYGDGRGSLRELVLDPARELKALFDRAGAKFVVFVEAAELQKIDQFRTDPAIDAVKEQIREFYNEGFEIGLHLHPQWCDARHRGGAWELDYSEYNLCTLPEQRIDEIVGHSIDYLRQAVGAADFTPVSFRAGNWLLQPSATAARVLSAHGIRIDSSVFKGGRQRMHQLDYRRASRNPGYWRFGDDVTVPDPQGSLLEIPTYTSMVPFWRMMTTKRAALQRKANGSPRPWKQRVNRAFDLFRLRHPLKFDFCRMTLDELTAMVDAACREVDGDPVAREPMVAIGHTKDFVDAPTVEAFLLHLRQKGVAVSTFETSECYRDRGRGSSAPRIVTASV